MHDATPKTAVVADARPLERHFLRFLLEEEGFAVRAEAGTLADLLLALQREPPTTVVVHEHIARDPDAAAIAQVRWLAPLTTLVVVTASDEGSPLRAIADTTVADGVGLAGLGLAVTRSRTGDETTGTDVDAPTPADVDGPAHVRGRWAARLQGALAASVVALAVIALRDGGSVLDRADGDPSGGPSLGVGSPDGSTPGQDPAGADGRVPVGDPAAFAGMLVVAAPALVEPLDGSSTAPPPEPPTHVAPAPVPIPPPAATPGPSETVDGPTPGRGPPASVFGRLKPKTHGARAHTEDHPRGGGGGRAGGPAADRSDGPGRGNGNGNGGRPPGWEHANGHAHGHDKGHGNGNGPGNGTGNGHGNGNGNEHGRGNH